MIKLQITGRHMELDEKIKTYVNKKIGHLDKYLPRIPEISGSVVLEEDESGREDNRFVCEVELNVKGERMFAKEATVNIYAAVDICEAKLKTQITKYKDKHNPTKNRRQKLWAKLRWRDPFSSDS